MRTLYVRLIITTMIIMIASTLIAFIASNIYYQIYLKLENDSKITQIGKNIVSVFEQNDYSNIDNYLLSMNDLGYTFYLVGPDGEGETFGIDFKKYNVDQSDLNDVLNGGTYHGIREFPWRMFVTGFFDSELRNTIGVPVQINGDTHALFLRPDAVQQFGEMRVFLSVMLVLTLLFSFILVLIGTRFIALPIRRLTEATKKIAAGNYHIKLKENRKDEIGKLAKDFSKMSNQLAQTEEKRQEFVSSVSHEIQSPLTSIQGFSQALQEEDIPEKDQKRYLSIIENETRRLSLLSKQLLTLSFLDKELELDEKVEYNITGQLKEVVSSIEWEWQEKQITIEFDAPYELVYGNQQLLHQVWMNLLVNAIKYTDPGGRITLQVIANKSDTVVICKDTGIGINQKDLDQIFERFYIADKARTHEKSSTGLGLAITKKIIELHEGTIIAESTVGEGSTFTVTLPKLQN